MRSGRGVRAEFTAFYAAAYPELAAQLLAITGDARVAKAATDTTLATAWRSWPSLRQAGEPLVRARWMAVHAAAEHQAKSGAPGWQAQKITGGTGEAAVVVAALQLLPPVQRRALVLHYMGSVSVNDMAALSGSAAEHIELLLDEGFATLAESLVWADTAPQHDAVPHDAPEAADGSGLDPTDHADELDRRFDWTAEALADAAARMPEEVRVPSAAAMLRRAALVRWSARAVPAAVGAACVAVAVIIAAQPDAASDLGRPTIYAQNDHGVGAPEQQAEPDLPPAAGAVAAHRIAPVVGLRSVALTALLDPSAERSAVTGTSGAGTGRALPPVAPVPAPAVASEPSAAGGTAAAGATTPGSTTASSTTAGSTTPGSTTTSPPVTTTAAPTADPTPVDTTTKTTTTTTPPVATTDPATTDPATTDPTTTDPTTTEQPTTHPTTTEDTTADKPTKDDSGTGSGKSDSSKSDNSSSESGSPSKTDGGTDSGTDTGNS
ncbi:MAG TPA: hypothetical protein VGE11_12245 [Pseudonocardia sp.]